MHSGVVPLSGLRGHVAEVAVVLLDPLTAVHVQPLRLSINLPLDEVLQGGAVSGRSPAQDVFIVHGVKSHLGGWSEHHRN